MTFEIVKAGRKFAVVENDEALVYLNTRKDAESFIDRTIKNRAEIAIDALEARFVRLAAAQEYLARRATRPVQLRLF